MIDYEAILLAEGLPPEIRPLTFSNNQGDHADGLRCVSMESVKRSDDGNSNRGIEIRKDWSSIANYRTFGEVTALSQTDLASYWSLFSGYIWESGITGRALEYLLDYADHGFVSRACRKFGYTRREGMRLIRFVWQSGKENYQR